MHFNSRPAIDRVAAKVALTDSGCLEWIGYVEYTGYARVWVDRRNVMAHRWVYEYHFGPIPDGLHIDHLCRNRRCVRPEHLEAVTPSENVRRGIGPDVRRAWARARTHCAKGHAYDGNTYVSPSGERACLTCKREKNREHYERNRQTYIDKAKKWAEAHPERAREVARLSQRRYRAKQKAS